jgi:hypothetical protein
MADSALDNTAEVVIGGEIYEIEASNLAQVFYKREFRSKCKPPFIGNLVTDMTTDYTTFNAASGVAPDWDDYRHILGGIWAMARAAGSVRVGFDKFEQRALNSTLDMIEPQAAASVIFNDLAPRTFFRRVIGGADGSGASDKHDGDGTATAADSGGGAVADHA